jgi:outer membrane protein OmpA-like peptidoglycan-associated protein
MRVQGFVTTGFVFAALVAGCATAPTRNEQLEQARVAVNDLQQDPKAASAAGEQLRAAQDSLQRADAEFRAHGDQADITHLAYIAQRQVDIGKARIDAAQAHEVVSKGDAERSRILLESRSQEAQQAEARAQAANKQLEDSQKQLADLKAHETERGMVLTLSDVLFDTNAATLKPGAAATIDRLGDFMQKNPQTRILIEGHTDSTGSESYNEELSRRRAQAVADALSARGIPQDRLQTIGRGQSMPVASNDTPAGRQQNRRVEIVFSDNSGRFAAGAQGSGSGSTLR